MSGNHNEDSRRPQESRKRAASIGSEHPSLHTSLRALDDLEKLLSSNEHEERFACNSLLAEQRDQFRPQLRSKPQLTTIASHRCVCVHLRFGKNRGPCTSSDTVDEEDDMYSALVSADPILPAIYTMRSKRKHPYHKHGAQEGHRFTLRLRALTPRLRPVVFYSRHHRAHQREMRLPMRTTMS